MLFLTLRGGRRDDLGLASGLARPSRARAWAAGLLLGLWMVASAAADGLNDLDTYSSRFYRIHTNLTKVQAAEYGAHMDLVYASYSKRFQSLRGKKQGPQNLYLLRSQRDYLQTLADLGINGTGTGGVFFWGGSTGLATWVEGKPRGRTLAVLQHEGFHQFARARLGDELPIWVNEGLAEYFEHSIVVAGKFRTGIMAGDRLAAVQRAVQGGTAIAFDTLLNTTHAEWNRFVASGSSRGGLQYAQSWLIVHFLAHGDEGRFAKAFNQYLVALSGGRDHTVAFRTAFGTLDTAPFARRWERFLKDAEPDNFSETVNRVQFLAAGMARTSPEGQWPETLEQLKAQLVRATFELKYTGDAGKQTLSATDDKWYGYIDDQGQPQAFTLQPTATPKPKRGRRGAGRVVVEDTQDTDATALPPTLVAAGLSPPVHLTWERDEEGEVRARVIYPEPKRKR